MDSFNDFHASSDNNLSNSWSDLGKSQTRELSDSTPSNLLDEFDYDALLAEPMDQFVKPHSLNQNKDNSAHALSCDYDELMNMDFAPRFELLGDSDLYAIPDSKPPVADNQDPAIPIEAQQEINIHSNPTYLAPVANNWGLTALPTIITTEVPSGQGPVGMYRNCILNAFTDPSTPLKVIDNVKYPFENELQVALERELQRQQDVLNFQSGYLEVVNDRNKREQQDMLMQEDLQAYLSSLAPTTPTPTPAPMEQDDEFEAKKHGNKRPLNIQNFDPSKFYEPLPSKPNAWGTINPKTDEPLFQYTAFGDLNPLLTYTASQFSEYIASHPLNRISTTTKQSGLTLWIQTVPADSGRRYPNRASEKCRFAECPDSHRTIRKGDFRVAFDEQFSQSKTTDPFHNAGYVHLFCLEKYLDFPQLCKDFNVRPDIRILREGKNKMAITRDHPSMENIVRKFIVKSEPWNKFGTGLRPTDYYAHTLNYLLTKEHLDRQPKHLQRIREKRGGNSIDLHMNNLDEYVDNQRARKEETGKKRRREEKREKRKRVDNNEESDDVLDEDVLQRGFTRPRASKRSRR
ncbi:hypothetical protein EG329_004372 [Mollisiaceae sp. DMI_Dod_QoI]|nr:hypothetical protein EG329_004372 [Helotiales sp. DMI_Dod_QoI]